MVSYHREASSRQGASPVYHRPSPSVTEEWSHGQGWLSDGQDLVQEENPETLALNAGDGAGRGAIGPPRGAVVKDRLPVQETRETRVSSLGRGDPLEEELATHSRLLAWGIPWTEEPGGLQSLGSQGWTRLSMHEHACRGSETESISLSPTASHYVLCILLTILSHSR